MCAIGAHVKTGEPNLDALYKSHVAHVELTDSRMCSDPSLINTSVGSSTYGNYPNESCMIIEELDERGLHEQARQRIAVWLKYQSTVGLIGLFTDHEGVFFGADGYESGASYDQHHGWVLWYIAKHFFFTGDVEWLKSVADQLIKGVDWVARQRKETEKDLVHSRGWEKGFLAAGRAGGRGGLLLLALHQLAHLERGRAHRPSAQGHRSSPGRSRAGGGRRLQAGPATWIRDYAPAKPAGPAQGRTMDSRITRADCIDAAATSVGFARCWRDRYTC